ncbi:MAG: hypothetical protein ABIR83_12040, partial [Nakamurella sp.]
AGLGMPVTGEVRLGELVAVHKLPIAVQLAETLIVGSRVRDGEGAISAPTGRVEFSMTLSPSQVQLARSDLPIVITSGASKWRAVIKDQTVDGNGNTLLQLVGPNGDTICGDECGTLPAVQETTLSASLSVVPEISGPAIPSAAVRQDAAGQAYVILSDGTRADVTVLGADSGIAIVSGLTLSQSVVALDGGANLSQATS